MKYISPLLFIFYSTIFVGQVKSSRIDEFQFSIYGAKTTISSHDYYGGGFDFKYYPIKKFGTGLDFSTFTKNTFNYDFPIDRPQTTLFQIGLINQYDFFSNKKFKIGASITNGYAKFSIADKDILACHSTRYGYQYTPEIIASNNYFYVEPGLDFSALLYSGKNSPNIYLNTAGKYRTLIGKSNFGITNEFSNFIISAGISIRGSGNWHSSK